MTDLDDRLKKHYNEIRLPDASIDELLNTHSNAATLVRGSKPENSLLATLVSFKWQRMQWAAALCLLVVSGLVMYSAATHSERTERTFREVAMNHATRLDLEFLEDSAPSIDQQMAKLPFSLVLPERLGDNYELLGSRYCSLAGNLAAHVKMRDKNSGKSASLFVTSLTDELKPVNNASSDLNGLDVELFQEGGLFYAFAHQS